MAYYQQPLCLYKSISLLIFFLACDRQWDNLLSTDEDLRNTPKILQINLNSDNNAIIILNYAYSDSSTLVLERKSIGGFETVNYIRKTQTTLVDTSFDKEINHTFVYRVCIKKDKHRSSYSDEKQLIYSSLGLNKPGNLSATSVELQGIRLAWNDKSNYEENYKIEKDEGSGYSELTTLSANKESYLDAISGTPPTPLQLKYRVKAFKYNMESDWVEITTSYSGLGSPTNLIITNSSPSNLRIEWQDNSQIETGYVIDRKKDSGSFIEISQVGANTTFFSDKISEIGAYSYRVRTIKDDIYSTYSNEVFKEITTLIPTDGLVAYYPFNGNANDESVNSNDGTVIGATLTEDRFGNANSAFNFNSTSDYLDVQHSSSLQPNSEISVCAWIKPVQFYSNRWQVNYILSKGGEVESNFYTLGYWDTDINASVFSPESERFFFWLGFSDSSSKSVSSSTVVSLDSFFFVVGSFDGNSLKIFINGVLENEISISKNLGNNNRFLRIGRSYKNDYPYNVTGIIDDIRIYDIALSEEDIIALYHEGGWDE